MVVANEKRGFGWKLIIINPLKSRQGVQEGRIRETGEEHGRVRAGGRHRHHLARTSKLHEQAFEVVLHLISFGRVDDPAHPDHGVSPAPMAAFGSDARS
jgi:hypothetical protein